MKTYVQQLNHTSDLGLKVYAESLSELFSAAGRALMRLMIDLDSVKSIEQRNLEVQADEIDLLFREWLSELLALFHNEEFLVSRIAKVQLNNSQISALVYGEKFDRIRHKIRRELKSITYHQLGVKFDGKRYIGTFIIDV
jgi:SHS2 domain-containing protein